MDLLLLQAADLIEHFSHYWDQCAEFEKPAEARQQLMAKIVNRVYVYDQEVIGVTLHGDFVIVLDTGSETVPTEVIREISKITKMGASDDKSAGTQDGSDGLGHPTCYLWAAFRVDYQLVVEYWLQHTVGGPSSTNKSSGEKLAKDSSNSPLAIIEKVA